MNFDYQRPRKLDIEEQTGAHYARFVAEPFERGYASTIGIAMRRVLLSMIEGAAITAVRIDGVLHEFSDIPHVYEDVLNIILNLKTIPFKLIGTEEKTVRIEKKGPGAVTSADIVGDGDVHVLDSGIHIAHLEENANFICELKVKKGVGYRLTEQNHDEDLPVDYIPVDADFSPVERVKYEVRPARVGKRTDFEKLILEVWTNGSITPMETLSHAGKILRDHLTIFLNYQDQEAVGVVERTEQMGGLEQKMTVLEKPIAQLGLSVRALKCLQKLGVTYVFELVEKTEHELLGSKNFGKKSLDEILLKLGEIELTLGQKLTDEMKVDLMSRNHAVADIEDVSSPEEDSETEEENE